MKTRRSIYLLAGLLLLSCPNPMDDKDLRSQIDQEVDAATAKERQLTIEPSANGIVSPSGTVVAKDNIPLAISATALTGYGMIGWQQTEGPGTVSFVQTASGVTVAVHGGNASIAPILLEKPKVLYTKPFGTEIAKSSVVAAVFSRQVDFDTVNLHTFRVMRNGTDQITDGHFSVSADGKTVKFDPTSLLNQYSDYVITIAPQIKGVLNLTEYQQGNSLITDTTLLLAGEYTGTFRTNNLLDNTPPSGGDFTVASPDGDLYYTGAADVVLGSITATDDSNTISSFYVKNETDAAYQNFTYDPVNPTLEWSVPFTAGRQNVLMYFEDPAGNKSDGDIVTRSIIVDAEAPSATTMTVNGYSGSVTEFVPAGAVSLTLSASDPDVDTGIRGSGESNNGTDSANRKKMRFGNTLSGLLSAGWETYATSKAGWSLGGTTEGTWRVYAQFCDAVGNMSRTYADNIYLDPTDPAGSFTLSGGAVVTNTESVQLAVTASDGGSGLGALQIDTSPGLQSGSTYTPDGGLSGTYTGVPSAQFTYPASGLLSVVLASGDGAKQVNLIVRDKVDNDYLMTRTITLDKTAPTGGSVTINGGALSTNNTNVTLQVGAGTDGSGSGVAYMGFSNSTSPPAAWVPLASTASWTIGSTPGTETVYVWFKDAAGNYPVSYNASDSITLDTTPPSGTISAAPSPTAGTVTISCNASNDTTQMKFSNDSVTYSTPEAYNATKSGWSLISGAGGSSANGTRRVYASFADATGNWSPPVYATVILDTIGPTATLSINSGATWTKVGTVTLTIAGSDANYAPATFQMSFSNDSVSWSAWEPFATGKSWNMTSGYGGTTANATAKYVYVRLKDPLGNTAVSPTYSAYDYIGYDTVVPTIASVSLNSAASYTNSATVTITLSASDPAPSSGLYQMRFSNNASLWSTWETYATSKSWDMTSSTYGGTTTNGGKYVYVQVQDTLGNISSYAYDYIIYDTGAPTGYFYIESGNPATSQWTDGYLLFYISDSYSTVAQRRLSSDNVNWSDWETYTSSRTWYLRPLNGLKTVYAQFKDGAGNISSTIYDQVTLAETYSTLAGRDLWGAHFYGAQPPATVTSTAASYAMSTAGISGSDPFGSSPLAVGTVLAYYGKMEIVNFEPIRIVSSFPVPTFRYNILTINLVTYGADGLTPLASAAGLEIDGTYSCDLDTATETATNADFYWRQDSSTVRYLIPQNGARFAKWK